jgi:hypothetical protein
MVVFPVFFKEQLDQDKHLSWMLLTPLVWEDAPVIEKLPESSGNILGFRIRGKLTEADYRDFLDPEMEKAMKEYPKIRVVWFMEGFLGLDGRGSMGRFPPGDEVFGSREAGNGHR